MTDNEFFHETVTFSIDFDVTIERRTEYDNWDDPTITEILEEALDIVASAPGFDWINTERLYTISLENIEGITLVDTGTMRAYLKDTDNIISVLTVMSGVVHEFVFEKHPDGGVFCDEMVQGGESYRLHEEDVPGEIKREVESRYGEIIE